MRASATELSIYSARDCVIQRALYEPSIRHLGEIANGLRHFELLNDRLAPIAEDMTWRGIRLDLVRREEHRRELQKRVDAAREGLQRIAHASGFKNADKKGVPRDLNPSSTPQLRKFFYEHLEIAPFKWSNTSGKPSLDESVLKKFLTHENAFAAESARVLLQERKWGNMIRTHIDGLTVQEDEDEETEEVVGLTLDHAGFVHPCWRPGGARTGRWSCNNPNLMNIPKAVREAVRDEKGEVVRKEDGTPLMEVLHGGLKDMYIAHDLEGWIVEADYAQIEARIVALLAGDDYDIELYARGADTHSDLAWDLFYPDKPKPSVITKEHVEKSQREIAKTARYALMYGAKPAKLFEKLVQEGYTNTTVQMCVMMYKRYFRAHDKVKLWQNGTLEAAQKTGRVLEPLSGRERVFRGPVNPNEALNFPVQTAAGHLINQAIQQVYKELSWPNEGIDLQLHDALYLDGKDPYRLAQILKKCMTTELNLNGRAMPAEVDISVGRNCGKLKEMTMEQIKALPVAA